MVQEAVPIERKENRLKSPTKIGLNSPFGLGPRSRSSKKEKKNYLSGGPRSRSYKKKRKRRKLEEINLKSTFTKKRMCSIFYA